MNGRGIAILGSTGSIGKPTLDVVDSHPDRFRVVALTANRNSAALMEQVKRYRPELAVLADGNSQPSELVDGTRMASGAGAILEAAAHPDVGTGGDEGAGRVGR